MDPSVTKRLLRREEKLFWGNLLSSAVWAKEEEERLFRWIIKPFQVLFFAVVRLFLLRLSQRNLPH